ncbi:MAG TPA: ABC transporter permease [Terriglobia bacterium]|nr:ABC transporter permease [Terriglobia bacterium]
MLNDLRFALRMLRKNVGTTAIILLTLALGIGANSAIFTLANAFLFRPLPLKDSGRLVALWEKQPGTASRGFISGFEFDFIQKHNHGFEEIGVYTPDGRSSLAAGGIPEVVPRAMGSAGFFRMMAIQPILGRPFSPQELAAGRDSHAVILSHGLWKRQFGSNPQAVGQTGDLGYGTRYQVIGIFPPAFQLGWGQFEPEMWLPMDTTPVIPPARLPPAMRNAPVSWRAHCMARLKQGVKLKQAQAELDMLARDFSRQQPSSNSQVEFLAEPLRESMYGKTRPALFSLMFAVGMVLLIACLNIANLLLARTSGREKEISIRVALGANRARIVRLLLIESLMLGLSGGVLGLVLAQWAVDFLGVSLSDYNLGTPGMNVNIGMPLLEIDGRVLGFTLLISVFTGILFGLAPALRVSGASLAGALKEGAQSATASLSRRRFSQMLVIAEVSLSLVLLTGAGLLIKSFVRLTHVDPGFIPEKMLTAFVPLEPGKFDPVSYVRLMLSRIAALPGVRSADVVSDLPMSETVGRGPFRIEGQPDSHPGQESLACVASVSSGYFASMGIPVLKGRSFTPEDNETSMRVAVISATLARDHFGNQDPIGARLDFDDGWRTVAGVVGDVKQLGLKGQPTSSIYVPHPQAPWSGMKLIVRTATDPLDLVTAIRREIQALSPRQPMVNIRTMRRIISSGIVEDQLVVLLMTFMGMIAFVLVAVGVYGVLSYSVSERIREFGVRIAMGAHPVDLLQSVLKQGLVLLSTGLLLGTVVALLSSRFLSSLLFKVDPLDPMVFVLALAVLTIVALLACYLPARRAAKVDPIMALRYE